MLEIFYHEHAQQTTKPQRNKRVRALFEDKMQTEQIWGWCFGNMAATRSSTVVLDAVPHSTLSLSLSLCLSDGRWPATETSVRVATSIAAAAARSRCSCAPSAEPTASCKSRAECRAPPALCACSRCAAAAGSAGVPGACGPAWPSVRRPRGRRWRSRAVPAGCRDSRSKR